MFSYSSRVPHIRVIAFTCFPLSGHRWAGTPLLRFGLAHHERDTGKFVAVLVEGVLHVEHAGADVLVAQNVAQDAQHTEEHLTEELLDWLLASASIEQYLDEGLVSARTLTDYLFDRMEAHDLRRADVVRASGLNATVVYDIFSGKSRPGRDHAIMLAFGLKCTLRETQRLLRLAGVSELWCKQRRDAIIIWCIRNGFDRIATDDELYRMGEATLLPAD